ncbi:MAG TPA: VWA domain-containing protein [Pyrinomonadaceae bacterium]|nr:VWA domain-containing protein [Pyrinomonadaceae bacterium]
MWLMRAVRLSLAVLFQIAIVFALCFGQEPKAKLTQLPDAPAPPKLRPAKPAQQEIDPGDVISVDTTEVLLPVTVRDQGGQIVTGLTPKDFLVFEDGVEQPLSDLSLRPVPVDVVLMVDTSSSAIANLDDFRRAAIGFAEHLAPDDRLSLIQFDDRVKLLQDWTNNRVQFRRSLNRVVPGMFTRFNDAVMLASHEQFQGTNTRRSIIILTDGIDSGRGGTFAAAARAALEAQVTVYVVSNTEIERVKKQTELGALLSPADASVRFNQLRIDDLRLGLTALDYSEQNLVNLTNATGGRLYKPGSFDDLSGIYAEVASELSHQYAIYYKPTNKTRDGRFRKVKVQTIEARYRVSARAGYYLGK